MAVIESKYLGIMNVPKFPFVGNIKIAWVNTAVSFKHELTLARTEQAAHFRRHTHYHSDQIVEIPDTDFPASHEIFTPFVKETFQEKRVPLWC